MLDRLPDDVPDERSGLRVIREEETASQVKHVFAIPPLDTASIRSELLRYKDTLFTRDQKHEHIREIVGMIDRLEADREAGEEIGLLKAREQELIRSCDTFKSYVHSTEASSKGGHNSRRIKAEEDRQLVLQLFEKNFGTNVSKTAACKRAASELKSKYGIEVSGKTIARLVKAYSEN